MKFSTLLIIFACLTPLGSSAQSVDYSYMTDRRFSNPEDLLGYDFRPIAMEIPNRIERELSAGDYSFGITDRYLYVEGDDIRGVYNLTSINTTEYGFLLSTVNARDARLTGHLKVILNRYGEAEALVFRLSPDDPEIIFFIPDLSRVRRDRERDYFTDRGELVLADPDSLWGERIIPLIRIHLDQDGVQERLTGVDSTWIEFEEVITFEEKVRKRKVKEDEDLSLIEADSIALTPDSSQVELFTYIEIRTKILRVRSIIQYDDGGAEDKTWTYTIKKIVERIDETARQGQDRYEWVITLDEMREPALLYFDHLRAVTRLEFNGKNYLVRGY
jgi:hypothetical protein